MIKQKILVVDSSVALKWLHQRDEPLLSQADKVIKHAEENKFGISMPELARYEIGNALVYKNLELPILQRLIERFYVLPIEFFSEDINLAQLTVEIAHRSKITYYDASFMALANKLSAPLVTDNPKHHRKIISFDIKIISLKDYK